MQPFISSSCPFCYVSNSAAYKPEELVSDEPGAVQRLHYYLRCVFRQVSFDLVVIGLDLVVVKAWCGNLFEAAGMNRRKFAVELYALSEKKPNML